MRIIPLLLLFSLGACASTPTRGHSPWAGGLGRKMVANKHLPRELVATDGTSCFASRSRFERVQVGDKIWCVWRDLRSRPAAA